MSNHRDFSSDKEMYAFVDELDVQGVEYYISMHNCGNSTVRF